MCTGGTTECSSGSAMDGGTGRYCADLTSDRMNCGACGNQCIDGYSCVDGRCRIRCDNELLTRCPDPMGMTTPQGGGEVCANTANDVRNCGACGNVCPLGQFCVRGACATMCGSGFTECMGVCRNLLADREACGACGVQCGSGEVCSMGRCVVSCGAGLTVCDGVCRDLQTDTNHCGMCGVRCAPGQLCSRGMCTLTCAEGLSECGGTCRDLQTDVNHCAACGRTCPTGQVCSAGTCTVSCVTGTTNCSGVCRDLSSDNNNCGACGRVCPSGQVCTGGSCTLTCPSGTVNCSGVCRNLQTDNANCGACGRACSSGQACVSGVCVGQGQLRFTLTWDINDDMDLHVLPPCGTEIYYGRPMACGGTLDRDDTRGRGPENIYWSTSYTPGIYRVCPEAFSSAVANALWQLVVVRSGVTVHSSSGRRGRTDGNTPCTASFPGVITLSL
jgi:hypothetical protein